MNRQQSCSVAYRAISVMISFPISRLCAFRVILRYSEWNPSGPGAVPGVRLRIALAIWASVILVCG